MLLAMRPPSSPGSMSVQSSPSAACLWRPPHSHVASPALRTASPAGVAFRAGLGRKKGLTAAGESMMSLRHQSRPDSRESEGDDGGLCETLWRKQQRDAIKKGSMQVGSRPESRPGTGSSDVGAGVFKAPPELPPLRGRHAANQAVKEETKKADLDFQGSCQLNAKRPRSGTQAQASACWEDLISFLELHKLPGAYALALSAHGIEDLSSLLLLDNAALGSLLQRCNIDAMDEILLLEALRSARPFE